MNDISSSGGGILILPAGQYVVTDGLNIPKGVSLQGVSDCNQISNSLASAGTVILANGLVNSVFRIEYAQGASVSSLSVYYPEQPRGVPEDPLNEIIEYPWTFEVFSDDCTIENITLYNSYNGIRVGRVDEQAGHRNSERHLIKNVMGTVLNCGICVDCCSDVGRIENTHFQCNVWGRLCIDGQTPPQGSVDWVMNVMLLNLTGYKFGWSD